MSLHERVCGCLLGHAIGDALGASVEGWDSLRIGELAKTSGKSETLSGNKSLLNDYVPAVHMGTYRMRRAHDGNGYARDAVPKLANAEHKETNFIEPGPVGDDPVLWLYKSTLERCGNYTDDTNNCLAVVASLLEKKGVDGTHMANMCVAIWESGPIYRGCPPTAMRVMKRIKRGVHYTDTGFPPHFPYNGGSFANGGMSKAIPIGLAFRTANSRVLRRAVEESIRWSHAHPEAVDGAVLQAAAIQHALRTDSFHAMPFLEVMKSHAETPAMRHRLDTLTKHWLLGGPEANDEETLRKILNEGSKRTGSSFDFQIAAIDLTPCMIWMICKYGHNPREAIIRSINLGGDADTLAAAVGAVVGALHGQKWIPSAWWDGLENGEKGRDEILGMASRLAGLIPLGEPDILTDASTALSESGRRAWKISLIVFWLFGWVVFFMLCVLYGERHGFGHARIGPSAWSPHQVDQWFDNIGFENVSSLLDISGEELFLMDQYDLEEFGLTNATKRDLIMDAVETLRINSTSGNTDLWSLRAASRKDFDCLLLSLYLSPESTFIWQLVRKRRPFASFLDFCPSSVMDYVISFLCPPMFFIPNAYPIFAHQGPNVFTSLCIALIAKSVFVFMSLGTAKSVWPLLRVFRARLTAAIVLTELYHFTFPLIPWRLCDVLLWVLLMFGPILAVLELIYGGAWGFWIRASMALAGDAEKVFDELDLDKDGALSSEEICKGLQARGLKVYKDEIVSMLPHITNGEDGKVSLTDFRMLVAGAVGRRSSRFEFLFMLANLPAHLYSEGFDFVKLDDKDAMVFFYVFVVFGFMVAYWCVPLWFGVLKIAVIMHFLDQGFADMMILETLRHGTHIVARFRIASTGLQPEHGGSKVGGTFVGLLEKELEDTSGLIHVFKDTSFTTVVDPFWSPENDEFRDCDPDASDTAWPSPSEVFASAGQRIRDELCKQIWPNQYKFTSGKSWFLYKCVLFNVISEEQRIEALGPHGPSELLVLIFTLFAGWWGACCMVLSPTVSVRYLEKDIERNFRDDPCYRGCALITRHALGFSTIGLIGTACNAYAGLSDLYARVCSRPWKFVKGVLECGIAFLLYYRDCGLGLLFFIPII